jgi:hypothetical protein
MLKALTSMFQAYQEMTSKDEIVFGEIIRYMIEQSRPMIGFNASDGYQSARFLMNDEVLYALEIILDKKIASISTLTIRGTCRNQLADPDDMIAMFKTDFQNILKLPIFGQMKINHEYNSVYATTAGVRKLGDYMSGRGQVNRPMLEQDLSAKINDVREALRKFKR